MVSTRSFLEFHDSRLVSAVEEDQTLELYIDAYVHEWRDDDGCGYREPVCILLGRVEHVRVPALPQRVSDGCLVVGSAEHEGLVPLPFETEGTARLELGFFSGERLEVSAASVRVRSCGERVLIEHLPPELRP